MASKSCKEFFTFKFRTVFKLFRHHVNARSNSATVTFFNVFKMCWHRVNAVLHRATRKGRFTSVKSLPWVGTQCIKSYKQSIFKQVVNIFSSMAINVPLIALNHE